MAFKDLVKDINPGISDSKQAAAVIALRLIEQKAQSGMDINTEFTAGAPKNFGDTVNKIEAMIAAL